MTFVFYSISLYQNHTLGFFYLPPNLFVWLPNLFNPHISVCHKLRGCYGWLLLTYVTVTKFTPPPLLKNNRWGAYQLGKHGSLAVPFISSFPSKVIPSLSTSLINPTPSQFLLMLICLQGVLGLSKLLCQAHSFSFSEDKESALE